MENRRILVIEDSKFYSEMILKRIGGLPGFEAVHVKTYGEAADLLEKDCGFFVALVDLHLPDSDDGGILDLVISKNISPIVMTADFDEELRERILAGSKVVDYVFKQESQGFKAITDTIKSLVRNEKVKILIAEDSPTQRMKLKKQLQVMKFQVLEAENGDTAFQKIEDNPDVKVVLTDYNMPVIDGFDLVKLIRRKFDKDTVAVIGISSEGSPYLTAKFLKSGANDFLTKPVAFEELMARLAQNLDLLEMIATLKDFAVKDPLTQLHNRRYFFTEGEKRLVKARAAGTPVSVGMIDIDFFKKVNDTHGHDAGDEVLKLLASLLSENTRGADVVARFGGEEFCVMAYETDAAGARILFEKIRKKVSETPLRHNGVEIPFTVSIGVVSGAFDSLPDSVRQADDMLYQAKAGGRNKVSLKNEGQASTGC